MNLFRALIRMKRPERNRQRRGFSLEGFEPVMPEGLRVAVKQRAGMDGRLANKIAAGIGNRDNGATGVGRIAAAVDKLSIRKFLQYPRNGWRIEQRRLGYTAGVERFCVVQHTQNTPLLFGDIGPAQMGPDWRHHGFARRQQGAGYRLGIGRKGNRLGLCHRLVMSHPRFADKLILISSFLGGRMA